MSLKATVRRYLAALAALSDANDRGQDDSGKRHTDSYRQWLAKDCEYTEALAELRQAVEEADREQV